jgi:GntR family transcriptional regulator
MFMNERLTSVQAFSASEPISRESLAEVTAGRIRSMIHEGKLPPSSRLPNELELAEVMGVSRGTIRAALHLLQQQGLIWRRQGVGTFVSEKPILENRLDINSGVTDLIESMGLVPGCQDMEIKIIPAEEHLAQQLRVPLDSPLVSIRRTRTANDKPVVASVDIFTLAIMQQGPHPLDLDALEKALEQKLSIYRIFEDELHITIDHGIAKIRPIKADVQLMKQLNLELPPGSVMLYLEQLDFDRDQRPVILSYEYHVSDFCTFTVFRQR